MSTMKLTEILLDSLELTGLTVGSNSLRDGEKHGERPMC